MFASLFAPEDVMVKQTGSKDLPRSLADTVGDFQNFMLSVLTQGPLGKWSSVGSKDSPLKAGESSLHVHSVNGLRLSHKSGYIKHKLNGEGWVMPGNHQFDKHFKKLERSYNKNRQCDVTKVKCKGRTMFRGLYAYVHMLAYKTLVCDTTGGKERCQVAKACSVRAIEFVTVEAGEKKSNSGPVTVAVWYRGGKDPWKGQLHNHLPPRKDGGEPFDGALRSLDTAGAIPCGAY